MEISPTSLSYQHPVGEGGTGVRGAKVSNSAIRVFAFESQHKAQQRRVAENKGFGGSIRTDIDFSQVL